MNNNTINAIKVDELIYDIRDNRVDNIAEGAQVNVIEAVQLNGKNLTVTDKTVNAVAIEGVRNGEQVIMLGTDNKIATNLSITYDSDAKEIKLMSRETQIGAAINATDFIKDGMVSNAELVAGEGDEEGKMFIEITFNSDAESDPIRIDVSSLVDAGIIAELKAILKGYGTGEGETTNVKTDIANLQGQIGEWSEGVEDNPTVKGVIENIVTEVETVIEIINQQVGVNAAQNAILAGYGTEEGETATVKSDIDNLQGQIDAIHTHDNKDVLDGITTEKVETWDSADRKISLLNGSRHLPLDGEFNINNYTKQGIYYFKGERINANDNLPIINAAPGHSISVQLTVLDASLSDTEMCVSQYLKLTNRTGSEGKEYIRTYNKYSDGTENWSAWREIKQTANLNQISDEDLKNYTENGLYEGVINNGERNLENLGREMASFIANLEGDSNENMVIPSGTLFTMNVLNNYSVINYLKDNFEDFNLSRMISQHAKLLLLDGSYVEVVRMSYRDNVWTSWEKKSNIIKSQL